MIILRQSLFTSAASFKPKFRARFRNGDFTYTQAKDPKNEALNHQAYVEVAGEAEFKNNPETYKIRQGMFSKSSGSSYPGNQPSYSQKRKFRERFRKGNFEYSPSKYSRLEAANRAAYVEVAGEDEFRDNPKARQIRLRAKTFSKIDVDAEGRGGALAGGMIGFLPGTVAGMATGSQYGPLVGMAAGTAAGAILGRSIARARAKDKLRTQLDNSSKIIPTVNDVSKELRRDGVPGEYRGDTGYQKAWREYKDDPKIKELESLCDDKELNDLGEKVDIYGTYGSKYISRPLKEAKLVDGSSMIYNIGDYHDGNGIAVKDGKLYPVYQYTRGDKELTKHDLHNFFESAKSKFNDEDEDTLEDYEKNGLRLVPRNPNNPYDKDILDYSNLAQSKIKNLKSL